MKYNDFASKRQKHPCIDMRTNKYSEFPNCKQETNQNQNNKKQPTVLCI